MSVGEAHPLGGQRVNVRGGDFSQPGMVTMDITVTKVVGVEDDDVGPRRQGRGSGQEPGKQKPGSRVGFHVGGFGVLSLTGDNPRR